MLIKVRGSSGAERTKEEGIVAVEDFASFGINGLVGAEDGRVEGLVGDVREGAEVCCEVCQHHDHGAEKEGSYPAGKRSRSPAVACRPRAVARPGCPRRCSSSLPGRHVWDGARPLLRAGRMVVVLLKRVLTLKERATGVRWESQIPAIEGSKDHNPSHQAPTQPKLRISVLQPRCLKSR